MSLYKQHGITRLLSLALTPVHLCLFIATLLLFHLVQLLTLPFGYRAHKLALELMNISLLLNFKSVGAKLKVDLGLLPQNPPLIIISNHQSLYDIPILIWYFRRFHPKFIAKRELGRYIPSVSLALRKMGSVLIDRDDSTQAIPAIEEFGQRVSQNRWSACIFPEGTRSRDGRMRRFKLAGTAALLRSIPEGAVIPVVIEGTWALVRNNFLPVPFGVTVTVRSLAQINRHGKSEEEIVAEAQAAITRELETIRGTARAVAGHGTS